MAKQRKEFTLDPDSIEFLKGLPARTASKKVDEAIKLLKITEQNPKEEKPTPTPRVKPIIKEVII